MFDRAPFRRAGRVMVNRNGQAILAGPPLQGVFPPMLAIAVAASGVRLDHTVPSLFGLGLLSMSGGS